RRLRPRQRNPDRLPRIPRSPANLRGRSRSLCRCHRRKRTLNRTGARRGSPPGWLRRGLSFAGTRLRQAIQGSWTKRGRLRPHLRTRRNRHRLDQGQGSPHRDGAQPSRRHPPRRHLGTAGTRRHPRRGM
ncbi:uncharacterized protein METZ01_LOCUS392414, partial [marine metagenome]